MATKAQVDKLFRDPKPILNVLGLTMVSLSRRSFTDQEWDGQPWPERYPNQNEDPRVNVAGVLSDLSKGVSVKARRFVDRPALIDTGELRDSITHRVLDNTKVEVGSNLDYADDHMQGKKVIQPVTEQARKGLKKLLAKRTDLRGRLGFLFNVDELETQLVEREFIGVSSEIERTLADIVEKEVEKL